MRRAEALEDADIETLRARADAREMGLLDGLEHGGGAAGEPGSFSWAEKLDEIEELAARAEPGDDPEASEATSHATRLRIPELGAPVVVKGYRHACGRGCSIALGEDGAAWMKYVAVGGTARSRSAADGGGGSTTQRLLAASGCRQTRGVARALRPTRRA